MLESDAIDLHDYARRTEDWVNEEIAKALEGVSGLEIHSTAERIAEEFVGADWEYLLLYTFGGPFEVKLTQYKH